uniref:Putative site-specific DNA endonuclease n=1 Tax=Nephroselmis olivacea TaxID=31312 RepID=Q9TCC7_NEPOL|nr:putative site-specific DNA endonuclease [Nephroselmis olivacea]AAF03170.1 putative site-specific DNA endonuclease [Nephroselmis olivacea]
MMKDLINVSEQSQKTMSRSELDLYKKSLVLNDIQRECIIGTLLGDASIMKPLKNHYNPNIKWEQGIQNRQYIDHIYEIMHPWVGSPPVIRNIQGGGVLDRQSVWFKTYQHPSFRFYNQEFYMQDSDLENRRRKRIPRLLHRWLTPRVLAYWFMDDGNLTPHGYVINTQCYPLHEQKLAAHVLGMNFGLEISIWKDRINSRSKSPSYKLYINASSRQSFTDIISPYILECMSYKLHL